MRTIASFEKGINVIEYITSVGGQAKNGEIAKACDIQPSNCILFLNTLIKKGYLSKTIKNNHYYLTGKLSQLTDKISISLHEELKNIVGNIIPALQKEIDENILIGVLNNGMMEFIHRSQSSKPIQIIHDINKRYTPHSTAGGKAILAFTKERELKAYFKKTTFESYTKKTLTTESAVRKELTKINKQKFAINLGEYENEIMAVSSPIFLKEEVIASLTVQFPKFRYKNNEPDQYVNSIKQCAEEITLQLNIKNN